MNLLSNMKIIRW